MSDRSDLIDVVVVGAGAMGAHHARVVAADPKCRLVAVVDTQRGRAEALAGRHGTRASRAVPSGADVVVVATPATTHRAVAEPILQTATWLLVEKPLADSVEAAMALQAPRVAVGFVERMNPAVRALGNTRISRAEVVRRVLPSVRGRDVDVLLDLAQHDLDLIGLWGGSDAWVLQRGDFSRDEVEVEFTTGSVAARCVWSRNATRAERWVRTNGPDGATELDLLAGTGHRAGVVLPVTSADALTLQWDRVVAAVEGRAEPAATAVDGLRAVRFASGLRVALCALGLTACDGLQRAWDDVYKVTDYGVSLDCIADPTPTDFGTSHVEIDIGSGSPRVFSLNNCDGSDCRGRTTRWFGGIKSADENAVNGWLATSLWTPTSAGAGSCSATYGDLGMTLKPNGHVVVDLFSRASIAVVEDTAACAGLIPVVEADADCARWEHLEAERVE